MLDEMNTGEKSLTKDSTDEVVDLNKQDDMEVEVEDHWYMYFWKQP